MDLDAARDLLYGGAPQDFVATRKELVAQVRRAGDREGAQRIAALRRPTLAAWLVNLLARDQGGALADLLALGPQLAAVHVGGDAAQLRALAAARRGAVDGLVRRAVQLAAEHGVQASDAVRVQVATALEAALSHHDVAQHLLLGALVATPASAAAFPLELFEQGGGSPLSVARARPVTTPAVQPPRESPPPSSGEGGDEVGEVVDLQAVAARRRAEQRQRALEQRAGRLHAELEQAAAHTRRAEREVARREARRAEGRQALTTAEARAALAEQRRQELVEQLEQASRAAHAAREECTRLARDGEAAEQELERARTDLAGRGDDERELRARLDELLAELADLAGAREGGAEA